MIICRVPYRCSLFGGSTDTPSFYKEYGSFIINFALNNHCYIAINKIPDLSNISWQAFYSQVEKVENLSELSNAGIRGSLEFLQQKYYKDLNKISIYCSNEVPDRTGLGTSSALVCGIINGIHTMKYKKINKKQLAEEAIYVERIHNNESGGLQDEIAVSFGGFNKIKITRSGKFTVKPLSLSQEFLEEFKKSSLLFYTNKQRDSFDLAKSIDQENTNKYKLRILEMAREAEKLFDKEDLPALGRLIKSGWEEKQKICSQISNDYVDSLVNILLSNGCYGVRLMGSGSSGFLFCLFDKSIREKIKNCISLKFLPVDFDFEGSKIIFNDDY